MHLVSSPTITASAFLCRPAPTSPPRSIPKTNAERCKFATQQNEMTLRDWVINVTDVGEKAFIVMHSSVTGKKGLSRVRAARPAAVVSRSKAPADRISRLSDSALHNAPRASESLDRALIKIIRTESPMGPGLK
ncbi:hypothetical protein EVAR_37664_1 [Eumeta japonica]|uniref:Uncharacterized protein n=1 Tax=Eumeta variegata TaxID=151549 RepID=A0A4C1YZ80_EUMVA|nr:hypothetical protein EVAR_37664_1 [Eumeta japonica]